MNTVCKASLIKKIYQLSLIYVIFIYQRLSLRDVMSDTILPYKFISYYYWKHIIDKPINKADLYHIYQRSTSTKDTAKPEHRTLQEIKLNHCDGEYSDYWNTF